MNQLNKVLLISIIASAFAGCSSTKVADTQTSGAKSAVAQVVVPAHLDANSQLSKNKSVYFDFDQFNVKQQYLSVAEQHGKYLNVNKPLSVRVEGNADERGGREYNLALGQKRAEAVAKALKVYGARDLQVEPVSWGKEKPKAQGHDEAAWAENRRVDVNYK